MLLFVLPAIIPVLPSAGFSSCHSAALPVTFPHWGEAKAWAWGSSKTWKQPGLRRRLEEETGWRKWLLPTSKLDSKACDYALSSSLPQHPPVDTLRCIITPIALWGVALNIWIMKKSFTLYKTHWPEELNFQLGTLQWPHFQMCSALYIYLPTTLLKSLVIVASKTELYERNKLL